MFPTKNNFLLVEEKDKGGGGKIIKSFFQGIITNAINLLEQTPGNSPSSSGSGALYTLMLSPKGRFLYDFFLYNFPDPKANFYNSTADKLEEPARTSAATNEGTDKILLEYNPCYRDNLLKTLALYNLHKKVLISEIGYHSYIAPDLAAPLGSPELSKGCFSAEANSIKNYIDYNNYNCHYYQDPRSEKLGARIIAAQEFLANEIVGKMNNAEQSRFKEPLLKEEFIKELISKYNLIRIKNCIVDSGLDLISGESFPLEYNLEYAFSFTKGCYVGQEVTARFKFKNQLKRKLFLIYSEGKFPVAHTELRYKNNSNSNSNNNNDNISLGKILSHEGHYALALLELEKISQLANKKSLILEGLAIDIL